MTVANKMDHGGTELKMVQILAYVDDVVVIG